MDIKVSDMIIHEVLAGNCWGIVIFYLFLYLLFIDGALFTKWGKLGKNWSFLVKFSLFNFSVMEVYLQLSKSNQNSHKWLTIYVNYHHIYPNKSKYFMIYK